MRRAEQRCEISFPPNSASFLSAPFFFFTVEVGNGKAD